MYINPMEVMPLICKHCGASVVAEDYFCPQCGKKLKNKPPSTSFLRQAIVYAICIFLPPLGLWPAVQYLRQKDETSKRIGIAAVILTVVSLAVTIWLTVDMLNSINATVNSLTNAGY